MFIYNEYETALIKIDSIDALEVLENEYGYGLYVFCKGQKILFTENKRSKDTVRALQSIAKAFEFQVEDREW